MVLHNIANVCDGFLLKNIVLTCISEMICDMIVFDMNHFHLCSDSLHRLFKEYAHYLLFIVLTNLKIFKRIKMPPLRISHSNNITPHITLQYSHAAYDIAKISLRISHCNTITPHILMLHEIPPLQLITAKLGDNKVSFEIDITSCMRHYTLQFSHSAYYITILSLHISHYKFLTPHITL